MAVLVAGGTGTCATLDAPAVEATGFEVTGVAGMAVGVAERPTNHSRTPPKASTRVMIINSVPLTRWRPCSPWYQASSRARTNPTASTRIASRSTLGGQPNGCATRSMPCSKAKAKAT